MNNGQISELPNTWQQDNKFEYKLGDIKCLLTYECIEATKEQKAFFLFSLVVNTLIALIYIITTFS